MKIVLYHVLHLDDARVEETDGIDQVQVINHSPYYDNEMIITELLPRRDTFCILSTNIKSISAKFNELEVFIQELRDNNFGFSAICLHEIWLNDNDNYGHVKLKGYTCISQGKSCSAKGCLIIYLHEKFNCTPKLKINHSTIWEGQFINVFFLGGGGWGEDLV